jgi:predicted small integral membrane protein
MSLDWMRWPHVEVTLFGTTTTIVPTAIILIALITFLTILTIWDLRSPNSERKGFFPVAFSRGERFFLSIVTLVGIHLIWIAIQANEVIAPLSDAVGETYILPPLAISAVAIFALVRWG